MNQIGTLLRVLLPFAFGSALSGAVTVSLPLNPVAPFGGQTVQLNATGLTGVVSNLTVTVTPPAGNGGAVTFSATAITPNAATTAATTQRKVIFALPTSLSTSSPLSGVSISIAGSTSTGAFTSNQASPFTISPAPLVSNISPGAGQTGTTVAVSIMLKYAGWAAPASPGQISVGFTGPGNTFFRGTVTAFDAVRQKISATVSIPSNATPGAYTVCAVASGVLTGQCPSGAPFQLGGFAVSASPALPVSLLSPNAGTQCASNLSVLVTGVGTHFQDGTTVANFGDGVTVNSVHVGSPESATVKLSIDCLAPVGSRHVTMATGGEFAYVANGFGINPSGAHISAVTPFTGVQGQNMTVTLTGSGTHWLQSGTLVAFAGGINVGNVTVDEIGQTLTASISISPNASVGTYSVAATTDGEIATIGSGFTILSAASPRIVSVSSTTAAQGSTGVPVTVNTANTQFRQFPPTFDFGPNIATSVTVNSDTQAVVTLNIDAYANPGARDVILSSRGNYLFFSFTVQSDGAFISSVSPTNLIIGKSYRLQVNGTGTHWIPGITTASMGQAVITRITVAQPNLAYVDVTIPQAAALGSTSLTMSTGGEVASYAFNPGIGGSPITLTGCPPSLSLSPSSGMVGTTVQVGFQADCVSFSGSTFATIDGEGVNLAAVNFPVGRSTGTANFVISPTAPAAPGYPNQCPNRTVTLTVPGTPAQVLTAQFCVTSTPAVLTGISPWHASPGTSASVTITGQFTHFTTSGLNPTTVGFGPNVAVTRGPYNVSATQLTVDVTIGASAATGWRQAFVNTDSEQLQIGFYLDPPTPVGLPIMPFVSSISPPSLAQGQGPVTVTITGSNTNFTASTIPILGQGVNVQSGTWQLLDSEHGTAVVTVDPRAPVGGRSVEILTPLGGTPPATQEVLAPPTATLFTVTPGIASISSVASTPATQGSRLSVNQGQIATFSIVGANSHFLDGETVVNFGSGITVSSLTVVDATHLTGQIAVSYSSATGLRGITVTTDGEVAPSSSDAVLVNITQPSGMTITPTTGLQGTEISVQVQGIGTNWINGVTAASFGNNNGLTVKSFVVNNATQQGVIDLLIDGTTYITLPYIYPGPLPYSLTVTTQVGQNIETESLPYVFSVGPGAAIVTSLAPSGGRQGSTVSVSIVGQNTNFRNGVTQALMTSGSCPPYWVNLVDVNVANVAVTDARHATLAVAVSSNAPTGLRTLCVSTLGENAAYANAFTVLPGTPTLNGVSPVNGQQGQTLTLNIIGQFTHWGPSTTATFGPGVSLVGSLQVVDAQTLSAQVAIDPLAFVGPRTVTITTGTEVVSGNYFQVVPGGAIITEIAPTMANQGAQNVFVTITGNGTHWVQGQTHFQMPGDGITVNGFQVNSATSAVAEITVSPTAALGTRTVYMATGGEVLSKANSFLITGGIPAITCVNPSVLTQGLQNVNVQICGDHTNWTRSITHVTFDGLPLSSDSTVNSFTSITAVLNVPANAAVGLHKITVQTGPQVLTSNVNVVGAPATPGGGSGGSSPPPTPYISYLNPGAALVGQTLDVNFQGRYTSWFPGSSTIAFGAGITVNSFQVTGLTSAVANITIDPHAAMGNRTVTISTGATETETTTFGVTVGVPTLSLIDPGAIVQGQTRDFDVVGQFTTFYSGTVFTACAGVSVSDVRIFGPTAARISMTASPIVGTGGCGLVATTIQNGTTETASGQFSISPGTSLITSVSPNTALQGNSLQVSVAGFSTHWVQGSTSFSFGGGTTVTNVSVTTPTTATMTVTLDALASIGERSVSAQIGGESATLNNAFVIQPGTPILLSSTPSSVQQQSNFSIGILGQYTFFSQGSTSVSLGTGTLDVSATVTSGNSITVTGYVDPVAFTGSRDIVVTNGTGATAQKLTLYGAFNITPGPAAISSVSPASGKQGQQNLSIVVVGTNTHFTRGAQAVAFGPGITVNSVSSTDDTHASVNISISSQAAPGLFGVSVTTLGESASGQALFTVVAATPFLSFVSPTNVTQGQTLDVAISGVFTTFTPASTVSFGAGITVNSITVSSSSNLTANITVSPTAFLGNRTVAVDSVSLSNVFAVTGAGATQTEFLYVPYSVNGLYVPSTVTGMANGLAAYPLNATSGFLSSVAITIQPQYAISQVSAAPSGRFLFQASYSGSTLQGYSVNPSNGSLSALGGTPVATPHPVGLKISPSGLYAYAANYEEGTLSAFAVDSSGNLVAVPGSPFAAQSNPTSVAVSPSGRFVYATNRGAGTISAWTVNPATGSLSPVSGSPFAVGTQPQGIAVTPSEQFLYVTNSGSNSISAFAVNSSTGALSPLPGFPIAAGTTPNAVALSPTGRYAYVANGGSGTVSGYSIDSSSGTLTSIPGSPFSARSGTLSVSVDPSGRFVYAANYADNTMSAYSVDVITGALVPLASSPFSTGTHPLQGETITLSPQVSAVSPAIAPQGSSNVRVTINGLSTHFDPTTTVDFGSGIASSVQLVSPTTVVATISLDSAGAVGPRTLTVTTGGEVLTLASAFTVSPGPAIASWTVSVAHQNDVNVPVTITGLYTHFTNASSISYGPGVTVSSINAASPTILTALISIDPAAATGSRVVTVTSGSEIVSLDNGLIIQNGSPAVTSVTPNTGQRGQTNLSLTVNGIYTNFGAYFLPFFGLGSTTATFSGSGITVVSVTPTSSTSVTVVVSIAANAPLGPQSITLATGPQAATMANAFTVMAAPQGHGLVSPDRSGPVRITPVEGLQSMAEGSTVLLSVNGEIPEGATVEFEVNGSIVGRSTAAPYQLAFTVPSGVPELSFRALVSDGSGRGGSSRHSRVAVQRNHADSGPLPDQGWRVEFFGFDRPLTAIPDLSELKPAASGYATALNQPNPGGIFGDDPLGADLPRDFVARYTGEVWIPVDGIYQFQLTARSSGRLAIDGTPVLFSPFTLGQSASGHGEIALKSGWHWIEAVYLHTVGAESLQLQWLQPGGQLAVLGPEFIRLPVNAGARP